jgi:hypothetical protein
MFTIVYKTYCLHENRQFVYDHPGQQAVLRTQIISMIEIHLPGRWLAMSPVLSGQKHDILKQVSPCPDHSTNQFDMND